MNLKTRNHSIDEMLSLILRIGLAIAMTIAMIGGGLLLWQSGSVVVNYEIFIGEPTHLKEVPLIFISAFRGDALAIIQISLLVLIATPIARVIGCIVAFAMQRDYLYVSFASFVLLILLYSFF